jgi:energy-coupling factor transport system ATP-binding protein
MSVALGCQALTVRLPGQALPVLRGADTTVRPGETCGVFGRSGSGKTTLLRALTGLVPWSHHAEVRGRVLLDGEDVSDLDPAQRAHLLATCLDRPESQLFLATPRHELAAARRLHGESAHLDEVVGALGVGPLLDRRILELSSGERQRVLLAVALAAAPRPILLDEPTAHLDAAAVTSLAGLLGELGRGGGAVLAVEQAGWRLGNAVQTWSELRDGELAIAPAPSPPSLPAPAPRQDDVVLAANGLVIARGGRPILSDVGFELHAGEIALLTGPNGAGKSTLARALAGHALAAGARVTGGRRWLRRPGRVALVLPTAELQLFADTVLGELALAGVTPATAAEVLHRNRLDGLAGRAPWTLSRGERQRLVHAALDVIEPQVMILDEPGQGLDPHDLADLGELIRSRAEGGRAYLIATHRREFAAIAHRHLRIVDGHVLEAGP